MLTEMTVRDSLQRELFGLLSINQWTMMARKLGGYPAPDVADFLDRLPEGQRAILFGAPPRPLAAEVFAYLEAERQEALLHDLTSAETRDLLAALSPDDRRDRAHVDFVPSRSSIRRAVPARLPGTARRTVPGTSARRYVGDDLLMKLGISLPQAGGDGSRERIAFAAREAERIGLDSVWVLDRLLRPVRPIAVVPGQPAQLMPEYYGNVFDPIETLTFAAALTERLQLGTSVVNALFHPPVILGKRLATLDQLSGGRVIAGIGQGWMPDEFAVSGIPMGRRGEGMAEYVAALRAVWGPDPVRHEGRFYTIPESEIGPKPAQSGGIPILLGCYAPPAIERAGRIADGYNPLAATWDGLVREVETFRAGARAAGRDADALPIIARANARLTTSPLPDDDRPLFAGTIEQWAGDLARVAELGIEHTFFAIDDLALEQRLAALAELHERVA